MSAALDELATFPQWVLWRLEPPAPGKDKPRKEPYCARQPDRHASSTDPATWATFDEAMNAYTPGRDAGVGFVFTDNDPFIGSDLDHCRENGTIAPYERSIIERLDSYTEYSPSETGVHILVRGTPPIKEGRRKGNIEIYSRARYFTVTGNHVDGTPDTIHERTAELAALFAELFPVKQAQLAIPRINGVSDSVLLQKMFSSDTGAEVEQLWNGNINGYQSNSEADFHLCKALAWWTGKDATRINDLFRASGLMRPKWDEQHGELTYGQLTVQNAILSTNGSYSGTLLPVVEKQPERGNAGPPEHVPQEAPSIYSNLRKELVEPPRYILRVIEYDVEIPSVEKLLNHVAVCTECFKQHNWMPEPLKPAAWRKTVQRLSETIELIETPEVAKESGLVWAHVVQALGDRTDDEGAILLGMPIEVDGWVYFRGENLLHRVRRDQQTRVKTADLWKIVKAHGGTNDSYRFAGGPKQRYYGLPVTALEPGETNA